MNGDDLTKDELLSRFLQLEERIEEFEQEVRELEADNEDFHDQLQQRDEKIEALEARLGFYEI